MIPLFIAGGITGAREAGVGVAQRIFIITFGMWFLLTAMQLRRSES
jgi:hypothetical protein